MLNIPEIFGFENSDEFKEKFLNSDTMFTELSSEKFEWFGPSPIEPFNQVADHRVQVHGMEGQLPRQADGHHHHTGDPEEEDVVPGLQQARGEERLEVQVGLIRPLQRREPPCNELL